MHLLSTLLLFCATAHPSIPSPAPRELDYVVDVEMMREDCVRRTLLCLQANPQNFGPVSQIYAERSIRAVECATGIQTGAPVTLPKRKAK